jgi:hypothetical protein
LASTTGNISGVYDMSGGAHEYVAAFNSGATELSVFLTDPTIIYGDKYFDKYNSNAVFNYYLRILGDATGELGPFYHYRDGDGVSRRHNNWYNDLAHFIDDPGHWQHRGGHYSYGVLTGQFLYGRSNGSANNNFGFRVVIAK